MKKTIKNIFDEIASESGSNKKMEILASYKDNELLKRVLYLALSKRIKFYLKQIPKYPICIVEMGLDSLDSAIEALSELYTRKVTGHSAIGFLVHLLSYLTADDAYIIERIIEKDCKIGMGSSNVNKIFKDLIEQTPYQGAKAYSPKLIEKLFQGGKQVVSQLKADGRYCNAIITDGEVELESRQGERTFLEGAAFFRELSKFKDCVLNGELIMHGVSRYESNGIIASLISINKKKGEGEDITKELKKFETEHMNYQEAMDAIKFVCWDTITFEEYAAEYSSTPYSERLEKLKKLISDSKSESVLIIESKFVKTIEEAKQHFEEALKRNEEGTIIKDYNAHWKDGKHPWQVKLKKEMKLDLKIVGFNYGTGKNKDLISSVNVESSDGLLKTSPTGIKEDRMKYITENQSSLLNTIVEVKCSGISQDSDENYSVLHPVLLESRIGEKVAANSLKECIEINDASAFL